MRASARIGMLTSSVRETAPDAELPYVALEHVESGTGRLLPEFKRQTRTGGAEILFRRGDVLFGKLRPYLAKVVAPEFDGCASGEFLVLRPGPSLEPRYFFYMCLTRPFLDWAEATSVGTKMPRTDWDALSALKFEIPSLEGQRAIANLLDSETTRIDSVIRGREELRELVGEKRRALLASVMVNGGFGGERNEQVRPLRAYLDVHLGRQRSPANDMGPPMTRFLRAANVKDGWLVLSDVQRMNFEPREQEQFKLELGDVLVSEGAGSLAAVGAAAMWNGELSGLVCFQNTLLRLRSRAGAAIPRFVLWWARYAYTSRLFAAEAGGVNIFHLSAARVRSIHVRFPSLQKQQRVAQFLDDQNVRMSRLEANLRAQVGLLRERRQALITAAVLGQIDMTRGVA
jgi:hypothetical protein